MKKIFAIVIAMLFVVSLSLAVVGCKKAEEAAAPATEVKDAAKDAATEVKDATKEAATKVSDAAKEAKKEVKDAAK